AFLQDTLVELLLWAEWDLDRIVPALRRLADAVAPLAPLVVRLSVADPAATVEAAAAERVDDQGERWWATAVASSIAATPWAAARGLTDWAAFVAFLHERLALEDALREQLPVAWLDLPSPGGGGPAAWRDLDARLVGLADRLAAGERAG
ncbi:MAG TPA: hypothetical protein VF143_07515, partial [Candidatus Nanopelagicales bacterium]